jgi:hypothetical protein
MLWVGLWVGKSPRILWQLAFSFSGNSFLREDHSEAAVWNTARRSFSAYSRTFGFLLVYSCANEY